MRSISETLKHTSAVFWNQSVFQRYHNHLHSEICLAARPCLRWLSLYTWGCSTNPHPPTFPRSRAESSYSLSYGFSDWTGQVVKMNDVINSRWPEIIYGYHYYLQQSSSAGIVKCVYPLREMMCAFTHEAEQLNVIHYFSVRQGRSRSDVLMCCVLTHMPKVHVHQVQDSCGGEVANAESSLLDHLSQS